MESDLKSMEQTHFSNILSCTRFQTNFNNAYTDWANNKQIDSRMALNSWKVLLFISWRTMPSVLLHFGLQWKLLRMPICQSEMMNTWFVYLIWYTRTDKISIRWWLNWNDEFISQNPKNMCKWMNHIRSMKLYAFPKSSIYSTLYLY